MADNPIKVKAYGKILNFPAGTAPEAIESALAEYEHVLNPDFQQPSGAKGLLGSLPRGAKSTGRLMSAGYDAFTGDLSGVEKTASSAGLAAQRETPAEQLKLQQELEGIDREQGVMSQIGDTLKTAGRNPMGTGQLVVEQLPNTAVTLAGGYTGFKAGALAGTPFGPAGIAIGGTLGFLGGMFLGNTLIEAGSKGIQKASDEDGFTPQDKDETIRESAIKGAVLAGVDAATLKLGSMVMKRLGSTAVREGAKAEAKVLMDAGVDMTSTSTINAALKSSPDLMQAARTAGEKAALNSLSRSRKAGIVGTGLALETVGEGVGEYAGEYAATGKGDVVDATIESLSSATMSVAETAYNYNKLKAGNDLSPEGMKNAITSESLIGKKDVAAQKAEAVNARTMEESAADINAAQDIDQVLAAATRATAKPVVSANEVLRSEDPTLADIEKLTGLKPTEAIDTAIDEIENPIIDQPQETENVSNQETQQAPTTQAAVLGNTSELVLPDGASLPTQWEVIDADSVKASLKEGINQPRDRTRAASDVQIKSIANNPDYRRLSDSPVMDVGSPVISYDGAIVAGNGRFEGVSQAHSQNTGGKYLESLKADLANKGIDPSLVEGMKKPILVRRITKPFDTRKLALASNSGASLQYSGLELAKIDADRMTGVEEIDIADNGDIPLTGSNIEKIKKSLTGYSPSEMASLVDDAGNLSQDGVKRVRGAILAKAYGNSPTLGRLIESTDTDIRNVLGALTRSAGDVAKVREEIKKGVIPKEVDVTENLLQAVEVLSQIKGKGQSLGQYLAQEDIFGEGIDPDSAEVLKFLHDNIRSQKRIAEFIKNVFDQIAQIDQSTEDIFGDSNAPTKKELLNDAKRKSEGQQTGQQPGIFDKESSKPDAKVTETETDNTKSGKGQAKPSFSVEGLTDTSPVMNEETFKAKGIAEPYSAYLKAHPNKTEAVKADTKYVENKLLQGLQGTGKFDDKTNQVYATPFREFYKVNAERQGIMPSELYERLPLKFKGSQDTGEVLKQGGIDTADTPGIKEFKKGDTTVIYGSEGGTLKIYSMRTPVAKRGRGGARSAMESFIAQADADGKRILLDSSPLDKRTKDKQLFEFYTSLGFKPTGQKINPVGDPEMRREPSVSGAAKKTSTDNTGEFNPNDPNILKQKDRAGFNPKTFTISLMDGSDLSSVIHEGGHFYLEALAEMASQPNAPEQIVNDFDTTLKWFGLTESESNDDNTTVGRLRDKAKDSRAFMRDKYPEVVSRSGAQRLRDIWQSMTLTQKRPYHEQWAQSFERYALEGKSPTKEMQSVFDRFQEWMLDVYKSLKEFLKQNPLAGKLNDEVRSVFDRLLATEQDIAKSREAPTKERSLKNGERAKQLERKLREQGYEFTITAKDVRDFAAGDRGKEIEANTAEKIAGIFGRKIVWIDAQGDYDINGVVVPSIKDTIFIDVNTDKAAHAVMGHELSHHLEHDNPDVYDDLLDALSTVIKDHQGYAKKYGIEGVRKDDITKEIVGDIMGDNFTKPEFWNRVAEASPSTFKSIADSIIKWLKNLILKAKSRGLGSDQWVTDSQKAQDILAKAIAKYEGLNDSVAEGGAKFSKKAAENTLIVQHNLTVKNLLHADRMGGLAAPSIAVTDKSHPLTGFGEITLLADKDLIDPQKGAKIFGSDIYSPRYPQLSYDFVGKPIEKLKTMLAEGIAKTGDSGFYNDSLQDDPFRELLHSSAAMHQFLTEQGKKPKIVYTKPKPLSGPDLKPFLTFKGDSFDLSKDEKFRAVVKNIFEAKKDYKLDDDMLGNLSRSYAEEVMRHRDAKKNTGKVDHQSTNSSLFKQISDAKLMNKFENYLVEVINKAEPKERIFQGYTNSGNRRYLPHDIDTVVKLLQKDLRGGENFKYGLGSVRAKYSKQFKSIEQIRNSKNNLMSSGDFDAVKKEVNAELNTLSEAINKYGTFSSFDNVENMLSDAAKLGINRALKENGFENVPDRLKIDIQNFLNKLRDMPTEYFEAKLIRRVGLGEFTAAVVPKDTPAQALEILKKNGITDIRKYKPGDKDDRITQIGKLDRVMFSRKAADLSETINIDGEEKPTRNSNGQLIHPTEEGIRNFWKWFGDSEVVDENGYPLVVYHGTSDDSFNTFKGNGFWFAENKDDADQYRMAAILNNSDIELPYDVSDVNELGYAGVKQILEEEGISIDSGRVIPAYVSPQKLFDAEEITGGETNVSDIEEAWNALNDAGIVNEPYSDLDEYAQEELKDDYEGKAWWNLLEKEGAYDWLKSKGYDGVKITDVNMKGEPHVAYMVLKPNQIKSATENTGVFSKTDDDIRFSFAGRESETADVRSLEAAQTRIEAGDNAELVRRETGWFKGVDDKWRYEINDKDASLKKPFNKKSGTWYSTSTPVPMGRWTLGNVLDHPALYAAYPMLKDVRIGLTRTGQGGQFSPKNNMINIGGAEKMEDVKSILLHEIQHGIQNLEDFARGGSPSTFEAEPKPTGEFKEGLIALLDLDRLSKQFNKTHKEVLETGAINEPFASTFLNKTEADLDYLIKQAKNWTLTPYKKYQRLAGEVESRNVQSRLEMDESERRSIPPSASQDTPDSEVIVTFNGKDMESAPPPANAEPFNPNTDIPETKFRKAQRLIQDTFNRFTVIQNWLKEKGVTLSEKADVYQAEERYHSLVANQLEDFREQKRNPLIEKIAKAGFTMGDVSDFLEAQHAAEANAAIQKISNNDTDTAYGITDEEAADYLAKADPKLAKLANELRDITEESKQMRLKAGLLSQDEVDAWESTYEHYIPVKGDADAKGGTGKGLKVNFKTKRRLGHGKRDEAVVENILLDHERAIMQVEKNRVAKHLVMMAAEMQMPEIMTVGQPVKRKTLRNTTAYEVKVSGVTHSVFNNKQAADMFKQLLPDLDKGVSPNDITVEQTKDQRIVAMASPMLAENEINAYIDGHAVRVQINDDLLARAYAKLGVTGFSALVSAGRAFNGYLSKVYTGYNPEFIVTNIRRDFLSGLINLTGEEGIVMAGKAVKNYAKSFSSLMSYARSNGKKSDKWIDMYRANGGNTGAAYLSDLERLGDEVKTEYAAYQGVMANLKSGSFVNAARAAGRKAFNATLKWIYNLNQAGENAMRLAAFRAMVESGRTKNEAAKIAKNITVNFNRKGELGAEANAAYLFFNASVQGTAAIAHAHFKGKHKYQAWGLSSSLVGLGYMVALSLLGGDDDEYDKIDDHTKSRNMLIKAGEGYVKVPVPYGSGFFWNLGRAFAEAEHTGEWGKLPWHIASSFIEEFTPFSDTVVGSQDGFHFDQVMLGLAPTVAKIPLQPAFNKQLFTGEEMYPKNPFQKFQPDREKYWRATQGTVYDKMAGVLEEAIGADVSPETLKHYTRTFTGGAGATVDSGVSALLLKKDGVELEPSEIPFVRKEYMKLTIREHRAAYYKAREEAKKTAEEFTRAKARNDITTINKLVKDEAEMIGLDAYANKLSKAISAMRDMQDAIRLDDSLNAAEKRVKIKELEITEQKFYDQYLDVFKIEKMKMKERRKE